MVLWTGGHVRHDDSDRGSAMLNCAVREIQEELRLRIEPKDLRLLGAIFAQMSSGTSPDHASGVRNSLAAVAQGEEIA